MREFLDDYEAATPWLEEVGFSDPRTAHKNFVTIAQQGVPLDLLGDLRNELGQSLPLCADPDRVLNNIERLLGNVHNSLSMVAFLLRKPEALRVLVQLLAASQYFGELIATHPEYVDYLWEKGHAPLDPHVLKSTMIGEAKAVDYELEPVMSLIRRHRHRELLRIGYRDIALGEPLERITRSISDLADAMVRTALAIAYRNQSQRYGEPRGSDGKLARLAVFAMGKLGGAELNYSSDIDLILLYDYEGNTDGKFRTTTNSEFFAKVTRMIVKLLSENTPRGQAYRVDLRLRPHGNQAPLCMSLKDTLAYYDKHGRTWERQALVKARCIAGSTRLGERFLQAIQPFVYHRFLTFVEINEIKAIKRQIEAKTRSAGGDTTNLKTGHGGIRDIEFVTQFLQLLHGGMFPELRERNTLVALRKLVSFGLINADEHAAMETAYRFLRKAEHRLQFMFDLQTHCITQDPGELDSLALRMGYLSGEKSRPGERFVDDLKKITERNRGILMHLMHELFTEDADAEGEPETDLMLDPSPSDERITSVLGRYPFANPIAAYRNLSELATEEVPFLSSVRCQHFLASIAPKLLRAISQTPDPDMALVNLEKVTKSLGAKGVLWESFSTNPPMLKLYVNVCSRSQFLSEVLINNPGMIDELLDALVMVEPPTLEESKQQLRTLLRGARDVDVILHSFKNTRLLQIGADDILGKQTLRQTTRSLSDLAETVVCAVTVWHWNRLVADHGTPSLADGAASNYALVGLGKLGGRELGYHGDLDLILVYDEGGTTDASGNVIGKYPISNDEFYTQLAQRIVCTAGKLGPKGRLYPIDLRLRPAGHSGSLVLRLKEFRRYYDADAQLWERQALTRARVVHGDHTFADMVKASIRSAICADDWKPEYADQIRSMRSKLERSRSENDFKRGVGGLMDVEFAVQMLQIREGRRHPRILKQSVWDCLEEIKSADLWPSERVRVFQEGYSFLRAVESRIRIVHNVARDDLPTKNSDVDKLAHRLDYEGRGAAEQLRNDLSRHRRAIREQFEACLAE